MKRIVSIFSWILYWLSWPLLVYYLKNTTRTRLLLMNGDKVLVAKGWISNGKWGLPGGGVHRNEEPAKGVIREVMEETGLHIEPNSLTTLGARPFKYQGFKYNCYYFQAKLAGQQQAFPHLEIREVQWVDSTSLNKRNALPDVLTALSLVSGS